MSKSVRPSLKVTVLPADKIASATPPVTSTGLSVFAAQSAEVMQRIGYEKPYHREQVIQEIKFYLGTTAEAMLEVGRRLIALKQSEPHGEFLSIVTGQFNMKRSTAHRMMQAAEKYLLNPKLAANVPALGHLSKIKLFDLMDESDEDLAALAEGGTLAGLTLNEMDCMTSRELKAALQDVRAELQSAEERIATKDKRINKLESDVKRVKRMPPDDALAQIRAETNELALTADSYLVGNLRQAFLALNEHHETHGGESTAFMTGLVAQLQSHVAALRDEFFLQDVTPAMIPEWTKEA